MWGLSASCSQHNCNEHGNEYVELLRPLRDQRWTILRYFVHQLPENRQIYDDQKGKLFWSSRNKLRLQMESEHIHSMNYMSDISLYAKLRTTFAYRLTYGSVVI